MEARQQPTAHGKRSGAARRKLKKEKQAMLDAQFEGLEIDPQQPAKLPAELVYYVLDIASYNPPPASTNKPRARQRRALLRSASLVCRQWRDEAQKLLWQVASIHSDEGARSFLLSAEKGYETRKLEFWTKWGRDDPDTIDGKLVAQVLEASRGVHLLYLDDIEELCPTALFQASLADTTSLTLNFITFTTFSEPRHSLQSLSHLDHLNVDLWLDISTTAPLIAALLQRGPVSATLELGGELSDTRKKRRRPLQPLLPPSPPIPRLETLDITLCDSNNIEWLSSTLRQCTSVKTLSYNRIEPTIFRALGSQIVHLNLTCWLERAESYNCICYLLQADFWSLERLRELVLEVRPATSPPTEQRDAIEQECAARGIECVWKMG